MASTRDPLDPSKPPNRFVQPVHSYYNHLAEIQDFHRVWNKQSRSWDSQGVTAETRLAVLAVPDARKEKELRNHVHPVDPTFPARFVVGESYKPTSDFEQDEYSIPHSLNMKATFVFLDVAPALRLQLVWKDGDVKNRNPPKGCIDLPFTGDLALRDFKLVHGPRGLAYVYELTFECNGGMVMEGHARLLAVSKELWKSEDRDLYDYAMSLTSRDAKQVKTELWQFPPDPPRMQRKQTTEIKSLAKPVPNDRMAAILPHLPGTPESQAEGGFVLPSFDHPPFFAWLNNNGRITVQPGVSKSPFTIMTNKVPAPMMAFPRYTTFPNVDTARLVLSLAVDGEYQVEKHELYAFCNPQRNHHMRLSAFGDITLASISFAKFDQLNNDSPSMPTRLANGTRVKLTWDSSYSDKAQEATGIVVSPPGYIPLCNLCILIFDRDTRSFGYSAACTRIAEAEQKIAKRKADKDLEQATKGESTGAAEQGALTAEQVAAEEKFQTPLPDPEVLKGQCKVWKDVTGLSRRDQAAWAGKKPREVVLDIQANKTTYNNTMLALDIATGSDASRWHPYLVNRYPHNVGFADFFANIADKEKVDYVFERLKKYEPAGPGSRWNKEQMEAIERLRKNPGGLLLMLSGPAGTGKSTWMAAIAYACWLLGLHVLWCAPANSNVEDFSMRFHKMFPKVDLLRMTTDSSKAGLLSLVTGNPDLQPGQDDFDDDAVFQIVLEQFNGRFSKTASTRDLQLAAKVFDEVENGTRGFSWKFRYGQRDSPVDCQDQYDCQGDFRPSKKGKKEDYDDGTKPKASMEDSDAAPPPARIAPRDLRQIRKMPVHRMADEKLHPMPDGWLAYRDPATKVSGSPTTKSTS